MITETIQKFFAKKLLERFKGKPLEYMTEDEMKIHAGQAKINIVVEHSFGEDFKFCRKCGLPVVYKFHHAAFSEKDGHEIKYYLKECRKHKDTFVWE